MKIHNFRPIIFSHDFLSKIYSCLCTLLAYIASNVNPDATDQGFLVFATIVKVYWSAFEYIQQTAFSGPNIDWIRVN